MSNFTQRAITGAVFVLVLVSSILYSQYSFAFLFGLIAVLGAWEFLGLTNTAGNQVYRVYGTLFTALLFLLCFKVAQGTWKTTVMWVLLPLFFVVFLMELFKTNSHPFQNIAFTFLGIIYVALPFSLLNFLVFLPGYNGDYHFEIVIGFFIMLWANDTGAYLSGRAFGKHKLFERISPKKTWEGSIGGAFLALLAGYFLSRNFNLILLSDWMVISLLVVITGSLGDLVESQFKRSINIKDSGTILPGHGGILDRFDGLLISVPFIVAYLYFSHT